MDDLDEFDLDGVDERCRLVDRGVVLRDALRARERGRATVCFFSTQIGAHPVHSLILSKIENYDRRN